MCTVVILRRPEHAWPLILAANRDEMLARPSASPGRHWPDRPEIIAGLDRLSGGSWLGINDHGVVAAVLNRTGSLGPDAEKRSRGELVLDALDHADAADAADALAALNPAAYRSFNLIVADDRDAFWLAARRGARRIQAKPIPEGLSIVTSQDLNDPAAPRVGAYLPLFTEASTPDPGAGDWSDWERLMASRMGDAHISAENTMCVVTDHGYGTVSSSLVALPRHAPGATPIWRFADGRPGATPYESVLP